MGEPTAYKAPGYPFALGALRALGVGIPGLRLFSYLLLALAVIAAYLLAREMGGRRAGALAATAMGLYPSYLYLAGTLYPQVQAMFLFLGGLAAAAYATRLEGGRRWAAAVGAGVAFGALIVTVPSFAWVVVAVLVWLALRTAGSGARLALVALAATLLLPAAWTIRNAVRFDALVPVTTDTGYQLLLGNNENATPSSGVNVDVSSHYSSRPLSELEQDRHYRREALDWVGDNPGEAALLYLGKAAHYFAPTNDLKTRSESSTFRDIVAAGSYLPLLALFVSRLALSRRFPMSGLERLLCFIVIGNALALAVYTTRVRYRLPLDSLMIVTVAAFLGTLWARARGSPAARDSAH